MTNRPDSWPPSVPDLELSPETFLADTEEAGAAAEFDPDDYGRSAPRGERAEIGKPYVRLSRLAILVGLLVGLGLWQGLRILVIVAAVIVMIFFHELGHFVMARRADMKVTEFMIGFGPRIASFRRGDVEYGIKAIPAGAYVKIIGMADVEEVPPADESRTYRQKGYWARMGVAVAGSAMHFIMALVLIGTSMAFIGVHDPTNWAVASVSPGSAAERAGVQLGDRIVEFDGRRIDTWDDMARLARSNPDRALTVVVERDGEEVTLDASVTSRFFVYGTNSNEFQVYANADGRPAVAVAEGNGVQEAGMVDGAVVAAVNGIEVGSGTDIAEVIGTAAEGGATSATFTLVHDGGATDATVDFGAAMEVDTPVGFFGVGQEVRPTKLSPVRIVPEAFGWFGEVTSQTVVGVAGFFSPSNLFAFVERVFTTAPVSDDEPATAAPNSRRVQENLERNSQRMISIVGAVSLGDQLAAEGWGNVLQFLALLNMAIGIFNLIPLPPFDGGHVLIGTYERIRELLRRDGRRYFADYRKVLPVATGVIIVMAAIGLMAIYLDLADPVQI